MSLPFLDPDTLFSLGVLALAALPRCVGSGRTAGRSHRWLEEAAW